MPPSVVDFALLSDAVVGCCCQPAPLARSAGRTMRWYRHRHRAAVAACRVKIEEFTGCAVVGTLVENVKSPSIALSLRIAGDLGLVACALDDVEAAVLVAVFRDRSPGRADQPWCRSALRCRPRRAPVRAAPLARSGFSSARSSRGRAVELKARRMAGNPLRIEPESRSKRSNFTASIFPRT